MVKNGAFLGKAVGAFGQKLVGQVAAGNVYGPAAQVVDGGCNGLAQGIVGLGWQTGQTNPDNFYLVQGAVLAVKVQGNQGAVVQFRLTGPQGSCGDAPGFCLPADFLGKLLVIGYLHRHLRGPEGRKIAGACGVRGDVEIIQVELRMGTGDNQGVRLELGSLGHDGFIGINGLLDFLFFSPAHFRQDNGRMGYCERSQDGHKKHLALLPLLYHMPGQNAETARPILAKERAGRKLKFGKGAVSQGRQEKMRQGSEAESSS